MKCRWYHKTCFYIENEEFHFKHYQIGDFVSIYFDPQAGEYFNPYKIGLVIEVIVNTNTYKVLHND